MSRIHMDINPVSHITVDAIGQPGERVFYLQGENPDQVVTLLVEKFQIQTLALAVENIMSELREKSPDLPEASPDYVEENMTLAPPLDPLFRVGELSLGYDPSQDLLILIAKEVPLEISDLDPDQLSEVRFWCTRSQLWAMARWSIELASRGRPVWPSTGEPILPPGEFSPKNNGHKTTPERKSMDKDLTLAALREGEMRLEGQFVYGSNYTFLAICTFAELKIKAVYKPMQGERPLWDFPPNTLARREAAAYILSEALGWNLVPPTVFRLRGAPMGPGSVQYFIDHDPNKHYFTFEQKEKEPFQKAAAFDLIINNADRKGGHFLLDDQGKLWLIDHGISFHVEDKLRTVLWDYAGQEIPQKILEDVHAIIRSLSPENELYQSLQPHLLAQEIQALKTRSEELVKNGVFPLPPEERRAYPWPLV